MKNYIKNITIVLLTFGAVTSFGQTWDEIEALTPSDLAVGGSNRFASEVAISGDYAIAATRDGNLIDPGAVYVYELGVDGTWSEVDKLTADDGVASDRYGNSIALDGSYAIVGVFNDDDDGTNSGAAYVYERNLDGEWPEVQKLTASDAAASDVFGRSVSIWGDYALVGAPGNDNDGSNSGMVYVFERDADGIWTEIQQLTAGDAAASDGFGHSVSITADYAIIGARGNDDDGSNSGSAYIFEKDVDGLWVEVQKLTASDAVADDKFGNAVDIHNGQAVVGIQDDEAVEEYTGAAYIFERDVDGVWNEIEKLVASDAESGKGFGWSVAVENDYAVIGSPQVIISEPTPGSAYIFQKDEDGSWPEVQKITGSEWDAGVFADLFAWGISISDNHIIAGAPGTAFENEFFAYIFQGCEDMEVVISSDEVCEGDEVTLDATSVTGDVIAWTGGVIDGEAFTPPVGTTTYTATGGEEDCALQVDITVLEAPAVEITATDTVMCEGEETTLTASGAETYVWDGEVEGDVAFEPPVGETIYSVTGTGDNGCESSVSIAITVNALPEVAANADNTMACEGDEVVLTGSGASEYAWDGGVEDGIAFEPPVGESTYTVTGTDENDCSSIDSILITIFENPEVEFTALADDKVCVDNGIIMLTATPADGDFSGTGVTGSEFDPNSAGEGTHTLFYSYVDDNGCSGMDSVEIDVVDCLGVNETEALSFNVYPNPFSDFAVVQFSQDLSADHQVVIYDVLGQEVWRQENLTNKQIKISKEELNPGVYLFSLIENGQVQRTEKLIVQ